VVSGVAIAVKSQLPEVEVIGVQVDTCAPFPASLAAGEPVAVESALTIADGIAVKRPGRARPRLLGAQPGRVGQRPTGQSGPRLIAH
jgi:threonine dehydratase